MTTSNDDVVEAARLLGKRGGPARAKKLTAKRRHEIAKKAGLASAAKRKRNG